MKPSVAFAGALGLFLIDPGSIALSQDDPANQSQPKASDQDLRQQVDELKARLDQLEGKPSGKSDAKSGEAGSVVAPLAKRIKFGGQIRARGEYRDPVDYRTPGTFGRPPTDNPRDDTDFVLLRARLHADAELKDDMRAFIELEDSRFFGGEANGALSDDEGVDLHQAFFEVNNMFVDHFALRLGRQELNYGDGRLVSTLDWSNIARAWDAAKFSYTVEGNQLDVFASIIREGAAFRDPTAGSGNRGTTDDDQNFNGIYFHNTSIADQEFDLYLFQRRFDNNAFVNEQGNNGDIRDYTAGLREKGKYGPLDQSFELAYQFGSRAHDDVNAWGLAAVVGITADDLSCKPRASIEYDFASGDRDPTDGKTQTFDPLFPYGHFYQGYMDIFAWKNGGDLALRLSAKPHEKWTLEVALHDFRLARAQDAWYDFSGRAIRRDPSGNSGSKIGQELDLTARVAANENLGLYFGWGHFFPSTFVRETGSSGVMDWVFAQATVTF